MSGKSNIPFLFLNIAILLLFVLPVHGQFEEVYSSFGFHRLTSMSFPSGHTGYCVGNRFNGNNRGLILVTNDNGASWTLTDSVPHPLYRTAFSDSNHGFATGDSGVVYRTANGGSTWNTQSLPYLSFLHSICALDSSVCFVADLNGRIRKTTNGGNTWNNLDINSGSFSLCMLNQDTGFLASTDTILKTINGGLNWFPCYIDTGFMPVYYGGLRFVNPSTGFALAYHNRLTRTDDGGATWTELDAELPESVMDYYFLDEDTGYAICNRYYDAMVIFDYSIFLKTVDGGLSWDTIITGLEENEWFDLTFNDEGYGFVSTWSRIYRFSSALSPVVSKEENPLIRVYPNPAGTSIHIATGQFTGILYIYNSSGICVYQKERIITEDVTLTFPPGLYIAVLKSETTKASAKFIVR